MPSAEPCLKAETDMGAVSSSLEFFNIFTTVDEDKDSDEESFHLYLDEEDDVTKSDEKEELTDYENNTTNLGDIEEDKGCTSILAENHLDKVVIESVTEAASLSDENENNEEVNNTSENFEDNNSNSLANTNEQQETLKTSINENENISINDPETSTSSNCSEINQKQVTTSNTKDENVCNKVSENLLKDTNFNEEDNVDADLLQDTKAKEINQKCDINTEVKDSKTNFNMETEDDILDKFYSTSVESVETNETLIDEQTLLEDCDETMEDNLSNSNLLDKIETDVDKENQTTSTCEEQSNMTEENTKPATEEPITGNDEISPLTSHNSGETQASDIEMVETLEKLPTTTSDKQDEDVSKENATVDFDYRSVLNEKDPDRTNDDDNVSATEDLLDISMIKDADQDDEDIREDAIRLAKENESDRTSDKTDSGDDDLSNKPDDDADDDSSNKPDDDGDDDSSNKPYDDGDDDSSNKPDDDIDDDLSNNFEDDEDMSNKLEDDGNKPEENGVDDLSNKLEGRVDDSFETSDNDVDDSATSSYKDVTDEESIDFRLSKIRANKDSVVSAKDNVEAIDSVKKDDLSSEDDSLSSKTDVMKDEVKADDVENKIKSKKRSLPSLENEEPKKIKLSEEPKAKKKIKVEPEANQLLSFAKFMADNKMKELTRADLEEFCLQKICEAIMHKSSLGEAQRQIRVQEQTIEALRKEQKALAKQMKDLDIVHKKLFKEVLHDKGTRPIAPMKITRSVGLQVRIATAEEAAAASRRKTFSAPALAPAPLLNIMPKPVTVAVNNNVRVNGHVTPAPVRPVISPKKPTLVNTSPILNQQLQARPRMAIPVTSRLVTPPKNKAVQNSSFIDLTDEDDKRAKVTPKTVTTLNANLRFSSPSNVKTSVSSVIPVGSTATQPMMYVVQSSAQSLPAVLTTSTGAQKSVLVNFQPTSNIVGTSVISSPKISVIPKQVQYRPKTLATIRPSQKQTHPAPLPSSPATIVPVQANLKMIPPKPLLTIRKTNSAIIVQWRMPYDLTQYESIASYQLYAYQETNAPPTTDMWRKVGDVKAMALPMACTLTQFAANNKYYFAVRPVDVHKRIGKFSNPEQISL